MKTLLSGLLATSLAASFAIASMAPVNATPLFVPKADTAQTDVQNVQYQPWRRMNRFDRRMDRRIDRRFDRRVAGNAGYYNGYRGYRDYHPGYRRYGDFWYPAAAFVAGALITGAIVNDASRYDNAPRYSGDAHVSWCYDRYRSYRAYDNTYNPGKNRPRRQCNSPFD